MGVEEIQQQAINEELQRTLKSLCKAARNIYPLAQHILQKRQFVTTEKAEDTYVYNEGVYMDATRTILAETESILTDDATTHSVNEVIGHISRSSIRSNAELQIQQPHLLCIQNGILNTLTSELQPHTPKIIFFNKLPITYDPDATCPKVFEFLEQVMQPEDILKMQEYVGYCLYKGMPFHKALMLVGTGANGKSTLIKLIKEFVGVDNCASISLQALERNRFAPIMLQNKLVNIFADLPSEAMKETSQFKILISGDPIMGERKFKHGIIFQPNCKMVYSANQVPISYDDSDAFYRRWEIITFPNTFTNTSKTPANPSILNELTTSEELSGMLNWALAGLKRLLNQGEFTATLQLEEMREMYLRMSDSVAAFQLDNIEVSPEDVIAKAELYKAYTDYCRTKRYPVLADNAFHRRFQHLLSVEDCRSKDDDGKYAKSWRGIRFKISEDVTQDTSQEKLSTVSTVSTVISHLSDSLKYKYKIENIHANNANPAESASNIHILTNTLCSLCQVEMRIAGLEVCLKCWRSQPEGKVGK